jgi:N-glycosylase/DNA lyase
MPEECTIIKNHEGYLVNSCTGEVVDFENYAYQDYSNLEYYERVSSQKRETEKKEITDMKKIVLNYLQSVMTEKEKEMFYKILQKVGEEKLDAAYYLAIYEYILSKENKTVDRNYLKFLKMKGLGRYAIRQKKKLLRRIIKEDPVLDYINSLDLEKREEALKVYEILKKKNLIYGRAETRKKILLEYLNNEEKKKELLEEYYVEELIRWNFHYVTFF